MPGFIGVGAGKWTLPSPVEAGSDDPEVYVLVFAADELWKGTSGEPHLTELPAAPAGGAIVFSFGAVANATLALSEAIARSADAGATWSTPVASTQVPVLALSDTEMYALNGSIFKTTDGGVTWSEIVPLDELEQILELAISSTNLYATIQNLDTSALRVEMYSLGGSSPANVIDPGALITGAVDDGVLAFNGDLFEAGEVDTGKPLVRLVAGAATTVTGLPNESAGDPYTTHGIVACLGTTAILISTTGGTSVEDEGVIYRSTDKGLSWTEVKRWEIGLSLKGGSLAVAYRGDAPGAEAIWWVSGALEGDNPFTAAKGLWRSTDDGLTWAFVPKGWEEDTNTPGLYSTAVTPGEGSDLIDTMIEELGDPGVMLEHCGSAFDSWGSLVPFPDWDEVDRRNALAAARDAYGAGGVTPYWIHVGGGPEYVTEFCVNESWTPPG